MEQREHIMETAISLFSSKGCKAATMDEIASAAGISKRTLYEQFSDKENLLEACLEWWDTQSKSVFDNFANEAENILDLLLKIHYFQSEQMVKMSIDIVSEIKKYYPLVFKNTILVSKEQRRGKTRAFLLQGQREGLFRADINIDLITEVFELMVYLAHENNMTLIRKFSYEEFFRGTAICFIRGISTEKGLKYIDEHYC